MISKKTKYGLNALILLAKEFHRGPVLISELSRKEKIPKKFLEHILLNLKNHGLLKSVRGKGGGYLLAKDPKEIFLGQGATVSYDANSKIKLVLGNTAGTKVFYNGQEVKGKIFKGSIHYFIFPENSQFPQDSKKSSPRDTTSLPTIEN